MTGPFDVTLKFLLENYPADWLRLAGIDVTGPVEVVDADLATITAEADKVFRITEPVESLLHLEPQSSYSADLPDRVLLYNILLQHRHGVPVDSMVLLLRPKADGPRMTGEVRRVLPSGEEYLVFRHRVLRVWDLPVDSLLAGGLGTLPLVPLAGDSRRRLPEVVREMDRRLQAEVSETEAASLWAAVYVLMGLQYPKDVSSTLLRGVRRMKDSVTYQAILEEGKAEGQIEGRINAARELLLSLATRRFGWPNEPTKAKIDALTDYDRLKTLTERVLDVSSWDELVADLS